ncbi:hypothetical protein BM1_00008 [Bipolaris maydis]|nr:hypothetical protein BM1_10856 [Bipolaris maydis]KAH7562961.1 hypothetical protein BM1_00008 [Bipolaris maydis]
MASDRRSTGKSGNRARGLTTMQDYFEPSLNQGVWDWDKAQIFPFKSTLRKAL